MAEEFELKGSIRPQNVSEFGNGYVDKLVGIATETAEALGNPQVDAIVAAYRNEATEKIECAAVTEALNSIEDLEVRQDLSRSLGATVKHVRSNIAFGAKLKAFKPTQRAERLKYCDSLLADLKARNAYPNTFTLNQVIRLCGSIEEASTYLEQIAKRGARPDGYTLSKFVQLSTSADQAQTMVEDFEMRGVQANAYVMNAHIGNADSVQASEDILSTYQAKGLNPDNATVAAIASNASSLTEAKQVAEDFEPALRPDAYILNSIVKHATTIEDAGDVIKEYAAKGVTRDNVTRSILIKIAIDTGNNDQATRWIKQMESEDLDPATRGVLRTYRKRLAGDGSAEAAE